MATLLRLLDSENEDTTVLGGIGTYSPRDTVHYHRQPESLTGSALYW
jgi:hypothetical protein